MSLPILLIFRLTWIVDNKIKLKKTMRLGNPICESVVEDGGQLFSTRLTKESIHGFIEVCPTPKYLYALYSAGKIYEVQRKSKTVFVFDWDGNPINFYLIWMCFILQLMKKIKRCLLL